MKKSARFAHLFLQVCFWWMRRVSTPSEPFFSDDAINATHTRTDTQVEVYRFKAAAYKCVQLEDRRLRIPNTSCGNPTGSSYCITSNKNETTCGRHKSILFANDSFGANIFDNNGLVLGKRMETQYNFSFRAPRENSPTQNSGFRCETNIFPTKGRAFKTKR